MIWNQTCAKTYFLTKNKNKYKWPKVRNYNVSSEIKEVVEERPDPMTVNAYKMCDVSVLPKVLMVNSNFWSESTCTFKVFQRIFHFPDKKLKHDGKLQLDKNTWKLFALC